MSLGSRTAGRHIGRNVLGRSFVHSSPFSNAQGTKANPGWLRTTARWTTYSAFGFGILYIVDQQYNASSLIRNLRTFWTCAMITVDYKMNFRPEKTDQIPQLQERVADRVYNLLTANGGLYIKIGQSIATSAAVLPRPMQIKFASLFDDAPQVPYSVVRDVLIKELGRPPSGPDGIFEMFEEQAVASASIAQVHRAKLWPQLRPDGKSESERWVAVKIQKPDVSKQMEWDLGAYRIVMWLFEHVAFDLPVYFVVDFVTDHLRQELDFIREAENARRTAEFIAKEPHLRDKVYIPKVYPEYSTRRVMTTEWIDGVRLSDRNGIFRLMGEQAPHQSSTKPAPNSMSSTVPSSFPASTSSSDCTSMPHITSHLSTFQGQNFFTPLKGGVGSVMRTMVELFSAQMFDWGWVHCDPHPGNVLIRPLPAKPHLPQLVLIDHGLYVSLSDDVRRDWARLWRSTLEGDYDGVNNVVKGWGMGLPDLMASFTLLRPTVLTKGRKKLPNPEEEGRPLTHYERGVMMKHKLKEFLMDTDRMPKELIFLSKNMRMVQGNNQSFGSPVNRIKITGYWASRSQISNSSLSFSARLKELYHHIFFRIVMLSLDLAFYTSKLRMWFRLWLGRLTIDGRQRTDNGLGNGGFEEELEMQMRAAAKEYFGIELGDGVFDG